MRVVAQQIAEAFANYRSRTVKNTVSTGSSVMLHGTIIARHTRSGHIVVTLGGWTSNTTLSRANDLCEYFGGGRPFRVIRGEVYYEAQPVNDLREEFLVGAGRVGVLGRQALDLAA